MKKNREWKWVPGRELVGATLAALAAVGDKRAAAAVIHYTRNPGCDFLFTELTGCLSVIGHKALPELLADVREGIAKRDFSYEQMQLAGVLGNIGAKEAVPLLREFLDLQYDDQWRERDFKSVAIGALAKLNAVEEIDRIAQEYPKAREETQYVIIESLKQLWKNDTKRVLQYMISGNGDHRTGVAGRILAQIGRREDYQALKGKVREGGPEYQAAAYGTIKVLAASLIRMETDQKTRAIPPLPATESWAKERSELRVLVDALEEGIHDERTASLLAREFEFLDGQMQFATLGCLAKYYGKSPRNVIAEVISPRGIVSALRSGSPQPLLDAIAEALPAMAEGERKEAIASELRKLPDDTAKRILAAMAASNRK
ncbi:MAG: hypothetical protein NTW87_26225 [Planctomycetota bacterium]|nr:hypothetical protein [Planctomycetota bacterium]